MFSCTKDALGCPCLRARGRTMTIVPFLEDRAFRPQDIQAMSTALEDVCKTLSSGRSQKR